MQSVLETAKRWLDGLVDRSLPDRTPGVVGRYIAYFFFVRILVFFEGLSHQVSGLVLAALTLCGLIASALEWINRPGPRTKSDDSPRLVRSTPLAVVIVLLDLAMVRMVGAQVFFALPIWEAIEFLSFKALVLLVGIILATALQLRLSREGRFTLSFRSVGFGAIFFVAISCFLIRMERRNRQWSRERRQQFKALSIFENKIDAIADLRESLESFNKELLESAGPHVVATGLIRYSEDGQIAYTVPTTQTSHHFADLLQNKLARLRPEDGNLLSIPVVSEDAELRGFEYPLARSLMAIRIHNHNVPVAALWIAGSRPHNFTDATERFLKQLSVQIGNAIERERLTNTFRELSQLSTRTLDLDRALDRILTDITEGLGFEFASVSLVDEFRGVVEMVRARNLPEGWIRRARCALQHKDIQADVLRKRETQKIVGWDDRLDREMFERYGHKDLGRFWVPVIYRGEAVAVIHGGCHRSRERELLTPANQAALEKLTSDVAPVLGTSRSHLLLGMIATEAIQLIGAHSATLHVYQEGETRLVAAVGQKADHLLSASESDAFVSASSTLRRVVVYKPSDFAKNQSRLWSLGVRSMAAFPLYLGGEASGVARIYSLDPRPFTASELRLVELFLQPMQGVIQNSLLLAGLRQDAERARTASATRDRIRGLAAHADLASFLYIFARTIRLQFDADSVCIYEFFSGQDRFATPPVFDGKFEHKDRMWGGLSGSSIAYRLLSASADRFQSSRLLGSGFSEREGIRSVAAIRLFVRPDEPLGLLFVNYRNRTPFSHGVRHEMQEMAAIAADAIDRSRTQKEFRWPLRALSTVGSSASTSMADAAVKSALQRLKSSVHAARLHVLLWSEEALVWLRFHEEAASWGEVRLPSPRQNVENPFSALDWNSVRQVLDEPATSGLVYQLNDDDGNPLGVLAAVGSIQATQFQDRTDLILSLTVALRAAESARRVITEIARLNSRFFIAARIQAFPWDANTIMRFILTGITAEEGLGMSRAAIFLWDDSQNELVLRCAIGSLTRDEALHAWSGLDRSGAPIDRLERALDLVERLEGPDLEEFCRPFREAVGDSTISMEKGAAKHAYADHRTLIVGADTDDVWRHRARDEIRQPFVCVPIWQGSRPCGVIVADNRFLPHEMSIAPDGLPHLESFADLCAASLASAEHRLNLSLEAGATKRELPAIVQHQSRLEAERLLRDLVHQVRQPIENAELQLKLAATELHESAALSIIETARGFVERARKVLHKSLFVADILSDENRPPLQTFRYISPREIEQSIFSMVRYHRLLNGEVRFREHYETGTSDERAFGDLQTLELAFWELLTNASKYADKGTDIIVRVCAGNHALVVEISNRGIPLSPQDAVDCKERGWRSRDARSRSGYGSGLGLYLVDRIAAAHNGTLVIEPTNENGFVRFSLGIPLSGEARAADRHSL